MELDKDIIKIGNKVYSEELCRFVSHDTNGFVSGSIAHNGFPVGIGFKNGRYIATCSIHGKNTYLGSYKNIEAASASYLEIKMREFERIIEFQADEAIVLGLTLHAEKIIREHELFIENSIRTPFQSTQSIVSINPMM